MAPKKPNQMPEGDLSKAASYKKPTETDFQEVESIDVVDKDDDDLDEETDDPGDFE